MPKLIGQKIVGIRTMTEDEADEKFFHGRSGESVIELEDGTIIFASMDEEGNGPGVLLWEKGKKGSYVLPEEPKKTKPEKKKTGKPTKEGAELKAEISKYPPSVQKVIREKPKETCYQSTEGRGLHYRITAYKQDEDGSVTVEVEQGGDSILPGMAAFGINPTTLTRCGCGEWKKATPDEMKETEIYLKTDSSRAEGTA